jgi:hypothetical protein
VVPAHPQCSVDAADNKKIPQMERRFQMRDFSLQTLKNLYI